MLKRNKDRLFKYDGYGAFCLMAELHKELFPESKGVVPVRGAAGKIYRAFNKVYTDGIEDAAQFTDEQMKKLKRQIGPRYPERDI